MSYSYQHLPEQHIRLAVISPGKFNDEIGVSIVVEQFSPETPPKYEALSYVWGSSESPDTIQITGISNVTLNVTQNLAVALRHIRFVDQPRTMWIDAICIDQSNDIEKGPQVALMGEIFRSAQMVVVWLGPEENESNHAMSLMKHIGSQIKVNWHPFSMKPSESSSDVRWGTWSTILPIDADCLCAIYYLFCRPWFERLWVRQEIMSASSAIVICGSSILPWNIFRSAWACICVHPRALFKFAYELFARLGLLRYFIFYPSDRTSFFDVRDCVANTQCRDP